MKRFSQNPVLRLSRERPIAGWRGRVRRQCSVLAAVMLASLLVGWTAPGAWSRLARTASAFSPAPQYTLAGLMDALQRDPSDWYGRVIRVRAILVGTPGWVTASGSLTRVADMRSLRLVDSEGVENLPLLIGPHDGLLAVLRWLPLVGPALPAAQVPRWGEAAVYRIQLRRIVTSACDTCYEYEAVLLDAAPGATLAPCEVIIDSRNCVQTHVWTSW